MDKDTVKEQVVDQVTGDETVTEPVEDVNAESAGNKAGEPVEEKPGNKVGDLPEWARLELAKVRQEAAANRIKLREYKDEVEKTMIAKSDYERKVAELTSEVETATLLRHRQEVAAEFGLPSGLVDFVQGEDLEALRKSAQTLASHVAQRPAATGPSFTAGSGVSGRGVAEIDHMSPAQLADLAYPRRS